MAHKHHVSYTSIILNDFGNPTPTHGMHVSMVDRKYQVLELVVRLHLGDDQAYLFATNYIDMPRVMPSRIEVA